MISRENVTISTYENGLTVAIMNQPWTDIIRCHVGVKFGSMYEPENFGGAAHFLEHLCFRGTSKYSYDDITKLISGVGGDTNAFTSKSMTAYYGSVPIEHSKILFPIIDEVITRPVIPDSEFQIERNVVLEEIAMSNSDPNDVAWDMVFKMAYPNHAISRRILGTEESVGAVSPNEIRKMVSVWNVPSNCTMVISGNFDDLQKYDVLSSMENLTKKDSPKTPPKTDFGDPNPSTSSFDGSEEWGNIDTSTTISAYAIPGPIITPETRIAMVILNNIIGNGEMSLMWQKIRQEKGLCYSCWSSSIIDEDIGLLLFGHKSRRDHVEQVDDIISSIFSQVSSGEFDDEIFELSKSRAIGKQTYSLNSDQAMIGRLMTELMRAENSRVDIWKTVDMLKSITKNDIISLAEMILGDGRHSFQYHVLNKELS